MAGWLGNYLAFLLSVYGDCWPMLLVMTWLRVTSHVTTHQSHPCEYSTTTIIGVSTTDYSYYIIKTWVLKCISRSTFTRSNIIFDTIWCEYLSSLGTPLSKVALAGVCVLSLRSGLTVSAISWCQIYLLQSIRWSPVTLSQPHLTWHQKFISFE